MSLEIINLTRQRVHYKPIYEIYNKILKFFKLKDLDVNLILVGNQRIRTLNKKYRKKDKPTDVLSFCYDKFSGEIFINLNKAKNGIERLFVHGILHILGYNHKNKEDAEKMKALEEKFLKC